MVGAHQRPERPDRSRVRERQLQHPVGDDRGHGEDVHHRRTDPHVEALDEVPRAAASPVVEQVIGVRRQLHLEQPAEHHLRGCLDRHRADQVGAVVGRRCRRRERCAEVAPGPREVAHHRSPTRRAA
ncbi:hypothetical protein CF8_3512 [Nocardioides sp. CF8]|nr:hypothetical protein CF8_3512 [Nocardioides sp. CF8]